MNENIKKILRVIISSSIHRKRRVFFAKRQYQDLLTQTHSHYNDVIQKIKKRPKEQKIRFGMYVVFDSSFGGYELAEILKHNSDKFSLKIVIVPDISRGKEHLQRSYEQTKSFFIKKYGADFVLDGLIDGEYVDYSDEFDVIYCANPYDSMVPKVFGVQYLSKKDVLPIYIQYCFDNAHYGLDFLISSVELSMFWLVIANTKEDFYNYKKYQLVNGKNVKLFGYAKMDSLAKVEEHSRAKKLIIIAPHHTVANPLLPLSNFLTYSDFFLKLPELYPEFDFVFRPHPLLFTTMVNGGFWTQKNVDLYLEKMNQQGIEYSSGGDYFNLFVNSDALIHDCGSFLMEYLYLNKPCCYMLRSRDIKKKLYRDEKKCLKSYFIAENENDIINFLDNLKNEKISDSDKRQKRFIESKIMYNYPNASKSIFDYICEELGK